LTHYHRPRGSKRSLASRKKCSRHQSIGRKGGRNTVIQQGGSGYKNRGKGAKNQSPCQLVTEGERGWSKKAWKGGTGEGEEWDSRLSGGVVGREAGGKGEKKAMKKGGGKT